MKMFDADKTRMIGLPCGEKKLRRYFKPFSYNTSVSRRDGQTELLTRDKNDSLKMVWV